jgi:hypothetical protein
MKAWRKHRMPLSARATTIINDGAGYAGSLGHLHKYFLQWLSHNSLSNRSGQSSFLRFYFIIAEAF